MTKARQEQTEYCSYHGKWYSPQHGCRSCKLGKPHDPSSCDCPTRDSWEQAAKDVEVLQHIVAKRQVRQNRKPAAHCSTHGTFFEQGARCYLCPNPEEVAKPSGEMPVEMPVVTPPPNATPHQVAFVEWLNQYRKENA